MTTPLPALASHSVFLLLLQLGLLLAVARLGAELVRRFGMPAVVGELAGGILLGPSIFGYFAPSFFAAVFPPDAFQWHLLDTVGTLGLVFLLLLTGLETDLKLVRTIGRPALIISFTGMLLPFAAGFALGTWLPESFVVHPGQRVLFSLFLATALAISAMPVIAKILIDLDLTKRNIGMAILSAGVIDDTAGWLVLSLIAAAASTGSFLVGGFLWTLVGLVIFIIAAALIIYPAARILQRLVGRYGKTPYTELVFLVVITLLCAAVTEWIGVHAFFGAFVAGVIFRQVPSLRKETIHQIEAFTLAVLAPVFLGFIGLKFDLWSLGRGYMFFVVLAVACIAKIVGALMGARWAGLRFWEAMAMAFAMNARGAMGLVVAIIGLSMGMLNQEMFSILVAVAMVTSLMAPPALRLAMRRVRMSDEESRRILAEANRGLFDLRSIHVLVATDGSNNAEEAVRLALDLASGSEHPVEVVTVVQPTGLLERLKGRLSRAFRRGGSELQTGILSSAPASTNVSRKRIAASDPAAAILEIAHAGYDLLAVGISLSAHGLGGEFLREIVSSAKSHIALVKAGVSRNHSPRRILVTVDGSAVSRVAVEFAVRYAEAVGGNLTVALLSEKPKEVLAYAAAAGDFPPEVATPEIEDAIPQYISPVFLASPVQPRLVSLTYDTGSSAVLAHLQEHSYDLLVIGAENRSVRNHLFFGYENERLMTRSSIPSVIVVPKAARG
jgi:Kef-type K+ transport system membrane component KefB/nucleotide-binding universal stress UspA family protein